MAGGACDPDRLQDVVEHSLDRKVCNTLNTCCVPVSAAAELVPRVLAGLEAAAAARGVAAKLHYTANVEPHLDDEWRNTSVVVARAEGDVTEPKAERIGDDRLGHEWEWEQSPEITLTLVESTEQAVSLFNEQSPRFAASLVSEDDVEQDRFWATVDAPFVGDGFTRWVDGQYALDKPELGLSNWQNGRLFGRGGVLSGESVFTVRSRVHQSDPGLHR